MAAVDTQLHVIMYHYVRDLPRTRFPRIKGMLTEEFRRQVDMLSTRYEMATLESALDYLEGEYRPARDLCLLTFDDGLKDHFTDVLPVLAARRIQGLFFLITSCLEEGRVAAVHKNHFLMAALDFEDYRREVLRCLEEKSPETSVVVDADDARRSYRWDEPEVAALKYLMTFRLSGELRHEVLDTLFARHFGDEEEFARELYVSWDEAGEMQAGGMLMGGHSHRHEPLAAMDEGDQRSDLEACRALLRTRLASQPVWPFSYPYGKQHTFNSTTIHNLERCGFDCAFATEVGSNRARQDRWSLRRVDPKDADQAAPIRALAV